MKKTFVKWLCVVLVVLVILPAVPLLVGAVSATSTNEEVTTQATSPLKVEITANKDKLSLFGKVEFTVTVTNTSNEPVENISVEALFGNDIKPLKDSDITYETLGIREKGSKYLDSFELTYYADVRSLKGLDILLAPFVWIGRLIRGGSMPVSDNGFNDGRKCIETTKKVDVSSMNGKSYDASTTVKVYYGEAINGLSEFSDADVSYWGGDWDTYYINNIINVAFKWETKSSEKKKVFDYIGGELAGGIGGLNEYEIKISKKTLPELETYCESLEKQFDCIAYADWDMINKLVENSSRSTIEPNDPWTSNKTPLAWKQALETNAWWLKRIQAPDAWSYSDLFGANIIGIVDSGFDTAHEDLALVASNEDAKKSNVSLDHGTQVAGIVGAIHNNSIGIAGVVPNAILRYYNWSTAKGNAKEKDNRVYEGLDSLVKNGAKVINFSLGIDEILSKSEIKQYGKKASARMGQWIENRKDFIVVQSAGNGVKNKGVDAINNGYFCSITNQNCYSSSMVSKQDIMNRVIIVTATMKSVDILLEMANGGSQIDIAAPGGNIYTTFAENRYNNIDKSGNYLSGTSFAAPMVTGVAALVWSIGVGDFFRGSEVKEIVCNSFDTWAKDNSNSSIKSPNSKGYPLLNAKLAVEEAIRRQYVCGTLGGVAKDSITGELLEGVLITAKNVKNTKTFVATTSANGDFSLALCVGEYTINVSLNGYQSQKITATVKENGIVYLPLLLKKLGGGDTPTKGTISGKVIVQGTNASLSGVLVQATKTGSSTVVASATTNASGQYSLTADRNATYNLKFTKSGYVEQTKTNVNLVNATLSLADVVMAQNAIAKGTITGKVVVQGTNAPLSGVSVQAISLSKVVASATTNASGQYSLTLEKNLAYTLKFAKSGYNEQTKTNIFLGSDSLHMANVVMVHSISFAGGDGTEGNPYKISTPQQLDSVRYNLSASYILINDIDLGNWGNWEPIGNSSSNYFSGMFDGNKHVIKNMTINIKGSDGTLMYAGLFGCLRSATVKNIGMVNTAISVTAAHAYAGGIAGYDDSSSTISNCSNTGVVNAISDSRAASLKTSVSSAGGIVGKSSSTTTYNNCYNKGEINATTSILASGSLACGAEAGGITGGGFSTISNCYNTGKVNVTNSSSFTDSALVVVHAGGIAGSSLSTTSQESTINKCYNTGEINATNSVVVGSNSDRLFVHSGGIVGSSSEPTLISNSYNTGNVTATAIFDTNAYAGGIAGSNVSSRISNCYNIGTIKAIAPSAYTGGIIGVNDSGYINDSYYLSNIVNAVGLERYDGMTLINVKALSSTQMKQQSSFTGFDFANVWAISPSINNGYPYLRGMQP